MSDTSIGDGDHVSPSAKKDFKLCVQIIFTLPGLPCTCFFAYVIKVKVTDIFRCRA